MISFSPCKINIGLNIINKREDGFHNIETVFYPIYFLQDIIEIVLSDIDSYEFSGIEISGVLEDNLCYKTIVELRKIYSFPPIKLFLHKIVPMGAGLGGGSANVATIINLVCKQFDIQMSEIEKKSLASSLGSDCAFFVNPVPSIATGKGNILQEISLNLSKLYLLIAKPSSHISSADAYSMVKPNNSRDKLNNLIQKPIAEWKYVIENDFEKSIFPKFPIIEQIKEKMYQAGAIYAQMSGSGSSVFGIFNEKPTAEFDEDIFVKGGWIM